MTDCRRTDLDLLVEARDAAQSGRGAELRRAAAVSQSELAAVVGVTPSAVSRWEAGSRLPRPDEAAAYARALRRLERAIGSKGKAPDAEGLSLAAPLQPQKDDDAPSRSARRQDRSTAATAHGPAG